MSEPESASKRKFGFDTRMLHAGHIPDKETGARAVPIWQSTSFVFDDTDYAAQLFELKQYGNIYTRINNPTTAVLEERMASLDNATGSVAFASGMAAQMGAFMALLEPGDEVVASSHLYGGTVTQLTHTFKKLGIKVTFVDPTDIKNWEEAMTSSTRALYGETIGNPQGTILDIEKVSELANSRGIPLIVDNTFCTPYLCKPMEFGATIVTYSATKFCGGHGNSLGGIVSESGKFDYSGFSTIAEPSPSYHGLRFFDTFGHYGYLMKVRAEILRDTGACLSPMNAFLLIQGLETLSLRMNRHVENALGVAKFLKEHKDVAWVSYAGLEDHPSHELAKKYVPKGPGAVFTFALKSKNANEGREKGQKFINALELFSHLANVGDARSLVIHPASTTHQQLSNEELEEYGIDAGMVRLSVGLETLEDLLWDLDQALLATSA